MTKEQIEDRIAGMDEYVPVSIIEGKLGMPRTTLQKVLKGQRELPKKWVKKLDLYFSGLGISEQLKTYNKIAQKAKATPLGQKIVEEQKPLILKFRNITPGVEGVYEVSSSDRSGLTEKEVAGIVERIRILNYELSHVPTNPEPKIGKRRYINLRKQEILKLESQIK